MMRFAGWRIIVIGALLALVSAGGAWALVQQLPPGQQVNNDALAGIDPSKAVSIEPPNADVVGGSLTASTGKAVPWAIFRQTEETPSKDQVFVRSFANGVWTTRGIGTVGGRAPGSPAFSGSLNFDQGRGGEAPAIDFAGAGRAVPWATWYENTTGTGFGTNNIFASRFDNTGDANQGKWIFAGQSRGNGGGTTNIPSLNIHTNEDAENPSVAGGAAGAAGDPTKPGPWITWQEEGNFAPSLNKNQIFVVKPSPPAQTTCTGFKLGNADPAPAPIGGFCWGQVGIERIPVGAPEDPTLNIDPTRGTASTGDGGIEPDIAFTGTNDSVPWVVWYEKGATGLAGLHTNEMVFAAKGVADATADGGFHWVAVGGGTASQTNVLNTGGTNHFGPCAESADAEAACSLNKDAAADAEDPRVASGTMVGGSPTVPWVVWDETASGKTQIFVARLVGGDHFELANNGAPISIDANNSTRPDITFSGNTPYVSWRENIGNTTAKGFLGHFFLSNGVPLFQLDESNIPLTPVGAGGVGDLRLPISSGCTANPQNGDGATCQGSAVGTPFALFTNTPTATPALFADAYQSDAPTTGTSSNVTQSTAIVSGSVNPEGAPVSVSFNFGTTTAYGQTITLPKLSPANAATSFTANLTGLPASTTIHYQAVVMTDFGTLTGADKTLTTLAPPDTTPPTVTAKIVKSTIKKLLHSGKLKVDVTTNEASTVRLSASTKIKRRHHKSKTVNLGTANATFTAAGSRTVKITVPSSAVGKLRALHSAVPITVSFFGTDTAGNRSKPKKTTVGFPRR